MQLSNDRQVNEKSFKIGMNSQNFARFDPLSWEKIAKKVTGQVAADLSGPRMCPKNAALEALFFIHHSLARKPPAAVKQSGVAFDASPAL